MLYWSYIILLYCLYFIVYCVYRYAELDVLLKSIYTDRNTVKLKVHRLLLFHTVKKHVLPKYCFFILIFIKIFFLHSFINYVKTRYLQTKRWKHTFALLLRNHIRAFWQALCGRHDEIRVLTILVLGRICFHHCVENAFKSNSNGNRV